MTPEAWFIAIVIIASAGHIYAEWYYKRRDFRRLRRSVEGFRRARGG